MTLVRGSHNIGTDGSHRWDLRYIDAPIARERDTNNDGQIDVSPTGDERRFYLGDANFNVTAVVSWNAVTP